MGNKNTFGERMKSIRKARGVTLGEIAKVIDRAEATVQRYESGNIKNLDNEVIKKIATTLQVQPQYLMGWSDTEEVTPTNITRVSEDEFVQVPIIGEIACGDPILADENIIGHRYHLKDTLPTGNTFYLKAKGDSMEPKIPDGSFVLIREQADVENGEIAAVLVNGDTEATLKKIRKLDDVILLEALNEAYDPYVVNEQNPARILGKAIEMVSKL